MPPKGGDKTARNRRAAPVRSKVFTIPAKNKVQRPNSLLARHNWQQKPESPSVHSASSIGALRLRQVAVRDYAYDFCNIIIEGGEKKYYAAYAIHSRISMNQTSTNSISENSTIENTEKIFAEGNF
ncbi:uncharacterized protein LOC112588050 [Harpegnathos saltator]|uniref:uncharacterized protein LOC112588050 n=1 Tax=Harpegnathos saltator TaxID=610380 RepID=UPI000DBEEE87|nr:uncharacterized protein LOC112588050 [Harpegnathos saltator]